ncbi:MAG: hypothetical protein U9Q74_06570 [Gemmatimonadota bacterium]|nr:hypothetical protein [Gemmatimonadota bacterium]
MTSDAKSSLDKLADLTKRILQVKKSELPPKDAKVPKNKGRPK